MTQPNPDLRKALDLALAKIDKDFGKGSAIVGENYRQDGIEVVSTGALPLDIALGIGGIPLGRVTEITGPEASGKTTFCYAVIAQAQKEGGICAFIDTEHAFDPAYAKRVGVDVENLVISQPDNAEQALDIAITLVNSGAMKVIVFDSVAAMVPRAELQGEMGDSSVGLQARLMSKALRTLTPALNRNNTAMIFTNQIREKIGVMFGSPETSPGGRALKFYASIRLDIRRIGQVKEGTDIVGNETRVKVIKNKLASPFKQVEFRIRYGEGFDTPSILLEMGQEVGMVKKSGAFFELLESGHGGKIQGMANARAWLVENPVYMEKLDNRIRAHYLEGVEVTPDEPITEEMPDDPDF
jgi:recombination protein RecA